MARAHHIRSDNQTDQTEEQSLPSTLGSCAFSVQAPLSAGTDGQWAAVPSLSSSFPIPLTRVQGSCQPTHISNHFGSLLWRNSILPSCQMSFWSDKPLEATQAVATWQLPSMQGEQREHIPGEVQLPLKGTAPIQPTQPNVRAALVPGSFLPMGMHFCPSVCAGTDAHPTQNRASLLSWKKTIQLYFQQASGRFSRLD